MNRVPTLDEPGLVHEAVKRYQNDEARILFIRDALSRHLPLGALLREAYNKDPSLKTESHLPMAHDDTWRTAMRAARAMTGDDWYPEETMEIALRHYWRLDTPVSLREWRTYRDTRDWLRIAQTYFHPDKTPEELIALRFRAVTT